MVNLSQLHPQSIKRLASSKYANAEYASPGKDVSLIRKEMPDTDSMSGSTITLTFAYWNVFLCLSVIFI